MSRWDAEETELLVQGLQAYGVGQWAPLLRLPCLCRRSKQQLVLRTQRLLGARSLKNVSGKHVDVRAIGAAMRSRNDLPVKGGLRPALPADLVDLHRISACAQVEALRALNRVRLEARFPLLPIPLSELSREQLLAHLWELQQEHARLSAMT